MKILLLIFCLVTIIFADIPYERKLYETILPTLFKQKPIKVYTNGKITKLLQDSEQFRVVSHCDATVVLLLGKDFTHLPPECSTKPIFATDYKTFRSPYSIGAFYWRKGRPQISFRKDNIKKFNLTLPDSLKRYAQ